MLYPLSYEGMFGFRPFRSVYRSGGNAGLAIMSQPNDGAQVVYAFTVAGKISSTAARANRTSESIESSTPFSHAASK